MYQQILEAFCTNHCYIASQGTLTRKQTTDAAMFSLSIKGTRTAIMESLQLHTLGLYNCSNSVISAVLKCLSLSEPRSSNPATIMHVISISQYRFNWNVLSIAAMDIKPCGPWQVSQSVHVYCTHQLTLPHCIIPLICNLLYTVLVKS